VRLNYPLVCLLLSSAGISPQFARPQQAPNCQEFAALNTFERIQFVTMSQASREEVSAQYLSVPGCGRAMLDALGKLGAKIEYADEKSGYVLVTVPREKLLATLDIAGIEYAYTRDDDRMYYQDPDAKIPQAERKPEPVPQFEVPYPRVAKTLAPDGPYYDAAAIGLPEFWKEHPEADGRGVTVAVPDEGLDLLHPELQQGRDAEGNTVPKVADITTLSDPKDDASWVEFGDPVTTSGGKFDAAGRTWTAPKDGTYRFGIYKNELILGPEYNAPSKKVAFSVGVLWDEQAGRVWVDTNGDGSFADERALGDYRTTHAIAWFGTKSGEEDNRVPFGVKIDAARKAVYLRIGGEHGNLVSGALAGNTWTGGLYDGTAPSAQVIDADVSRNTMLAEIVDEFKRPEVSVINRSGGIGRSGYTGLREGIEDFAQHVIEREIQVYGKPMAAYGAAIGMIHVNDYAGPEMLKRNRQLGPPYRDTINSFVWDGILNVVLGTSANLETDSRYKPSDLVFPDGIRYMWTDGKKNPPAPDGYVIGANNSPTIPVVSGVLADLISEAKREHIRYDAIRLNNAIFTGARLLDGMPVSQQGYGLVNAARSWDQLTKMAKADDQANSELTSFTLASCADEEKCGDIQEFHKDLNQAGEKVDGEVWITRHGGYAGARKYALSLRGDAKSFELLDHEATFERDKPVRIRFRASGAPGWNIALLELRDSQADVVMQDVPLSVRAPATPDVTAPGVDKYTATIPPLTSQNAYVHVGEDVQAARYVMQIPYTGPENISTRSGPGIRYRTDKTPPGDPVDAAHHVGPMETLESLVVNDTPGNQDIFWENRGRPEYATQYDGPAPDVPIHAELTVTKFAIGIEREGDKLILKNQQAAVDGRAELYDATLQTQSLTGAGLHAMGSLDVTLPDHLAEWRLRVTSAATLAGPADVYVFNCTGKNGCYVAATGEISAEQKTVVIENPPAGEWQIAVRSRGQVQRDLEYSLHEAMLTAATTPIEANDSRHAHGDSWTVPLPDKHADAQYAAFRIAGEPGNKREQDGLLVAITPLDGNAP
jgi:hypothetical protein